MNGMNTSLKSAAVVGLDTEVEVGTAELQALTEYVAAAQKVQKAFAQEAPMRGPATPTQIEDPQPFTVFNRTGLKVEDLPSVASGDDDGDDDFDEHITALHAAIGRAQKKGLVDPTMQAQ